MLMLIQLCKLSDSEAEIALSQYLSYFMKRPIFSLLCQLDGRIQKLVLFLVG